MLACLVESSMFTSLSLGFVCFVSIEDVLHMALLGIKILIECLPQKWVWIYLGQAVYLSLPGLAGYAIWVENLVENLIWWYSG